MISTSSNRKRHYAVHLFGLMASLPFLVPFHDLPIPSFHAEWLTMLLGVIGAMLVPAGWGGGISLHIPRIVILPLALMSVILLQLALGMFAYGASAFTVIVYLLWSVLLTVAGRTLMAANDESAVVGFLARCLLVGGLVNAVAGLLQYFNLFAVFGGLVCEPQPLSENGIYGNLAQQSHFATHIALTMASAAYLHCTRQLALRWFLPVGLALLVVLMLSGSRSGFLYLGWIVVITLFLMRPQLGGSMLRRIGWGAAAMLAGFVLVLWLVVHLGWANPQIERLFALSGDKTPIGPRIFLWQHAIRMFLEHPLLGVGFDAFALQLIGQLQSTITIRTVDQYAHNLLLQLLAVSGLIGFMAFVGPFAFFLRRQVAATRTVAQVWLWGVLGILLIHSMLEQPLYYAYFLGIFALVAGMSDSQAWTLRLGMKWRVLAVLLVLLAVGVLFKTAVDYDRLKRHFYSDASAGMAEAHVQAARRNVLQELNAHSIFAPLTELISPADFAAANASPVEKLALNSRIMHYAPIPETVFRQAALFAENGRMPEAIVQFRQAARAYPNDARQYAARIEALAATRPDVYGALAEYASGLLATH